MRAIRLIILVVACILTAGGRAQTQASKISLERTACYGTCPLYKLTVYSDGKVEYEGKDYVKEKGSRNAAINEKDFLKLMKKVDTIGFFKLKDRYDSQENADGSITFVTDLPSQITTVTKGHVTKTVTNYFGGPKGLYELEQLIDDLTNSARWTGRPNVDKDIPYYDSFPLHRESKFRGLLEVARYGGGASANAPKWKSKYVLTLMKNPLAFDVQAAKSIDFSRFDGYIVDVTGTLNKSGTGDHTLNVSEIRPVRRYFVDAR